MQKVFGHLNFFVCLSRQTEISNNTLGIYCSFRCLDSNESTGLVQMNSVK